MGKWICRNEHIVRAMGPGNIIVVPKTCPSWHPGSGPATPREGCSLYHCLGGGIGGAAVQGHGVDP